MLNDDIKNLMFKMNLLIMMNIGLIGIISIGFNLHTELMSSMYEGYTSIEKHKITKLKELYNTIDSVHTEQFNELKQLIKERK